MRHNGRHEKAGSLRKRISTSASSCSERFEITISDAIGMAFWWKAMLIRSANEIFKSINRAECPQFSSTL